MFIHCNLCRLLEKKNTFLFCLFFFVLPEILLHGNETDVRELLGIKRGILARYICRIVFVAFDPGRHRHRLYSSAREKDQ